MDVPIATLETDKRIWTVFTKMGAYLLTEQLEMDGDISRDERVSLNMQVAHSHLAESMNGQDEEILSNDKPV